MEKRVIFEGPWECSGVLQSQAKLDQKHISRKHFQKQICHIPTFLFSFLLGNGNEGD